MKLIEDLGIVDFGTYRKRMGKYLCDCGKEFETKTSSVTSKLVKSCGCLKAKQLTDRNKTHGKSKHKLYPIWLSQKGRCTNPRAKQYKDYGGRGIYVSNEFLNFSVWLEYMESLKNYKIDGYTLDRIDNDKGYERGNMRWAKRTTQAHNTRKLRSSNKTGFRGVYKDGKKFVSNIMVDGNRTIIGRFNTAKEAGDAYDSYILENNLDHTKNKEIE